MVVGYNEGRSKVGGAMSLRTSPTLTAALIASNHRSAKKFTVPWALRGKAWTRLSRLREDKPLKEMLKMKDEPYG